MTELRLLRRGFVAVVIDYADGTCSNGLIADALKLRPGAKTIELSISLMRGRRSTDGGTEFELPTRELYRKLRTIETVRVLDGRLLLPFASALKDNPDASLVVRISFPGDIVHSMLCSSEYSGSGPAVCQAQVHGYLDHKGAKSGDIRYIAVLEE